MLQSDMPKMSDETWAVRSRGWDLWKKKELADGGDITLAEIAKRCGIGVSTVQGILSRKDAPVSGVLLKPGMAVADYFGVPMNDFGEVGGLFYRGQPMTTEEKGRQRNRAERKYEKPGRPKKPEVAE